MDLSAGLSVRAIEVQLGDAAALIELRRQITSAARKLRFGLVEETKLLTAGSELARNVLQHAGSGRVAIEVLEEFYRAGIRLTFEDCGPGIPDVDLAMQDGYTSGRGMGMGLPGAKRLSHEFSIATVVGQGTIVAIVMWKR